jgi:hypothetical protein
MASKELSFNLGIGPSLSVEITDKDIESELFKLYLAINTLASKLDDYTGTLTQNVADRPYIPHVFANRAAYTNRLYLYATVALLKGTIVHMTATGQLAKAAASSELTCRNIFIVLEDTAVGNYAPVARHAVVGGFVGLTQNAEYYLSTTAGAITSTLPGTGNYKVVVGTALDSNTLLFYPAYGARAVI